MLITLDLPPGLYRQGTKYQSKNKWYEAQLVRFLEGTIRPVGGWARISESTAASLHAQDLFTADPGNISLDYTTSGYISDLEFNGWDVQTPADKQLKPDPSTHLAFESPTGDMSIKSRDAIEFSDFTAFMDVKWTDGDDGDTQVGMYVRANDEYQTDVGSEGLLFAVRMLHSQSGLSVSDTFYEVSTPLDLNLHTADTGETWDVALQFGTIPQWVVVSGSQSQNNFSTGTALYCMQDSGGAAMEADEEAYCDMWRGTGHVGGGTYVGFHFMVGTGGRAATEYSTLLVEFSSNQINMSRRYGGGLDNYTGSGSGLTWPYETFKRIGVTVHGPDSYTFWTEDEGGGNRVIYDTWTPLPSVASSPVGDANYGRMGMLVDGVNFITGTKPLWKNLNQTGGEPSDDGFQIFAYRVIDGIPYALSDDGGATVENYYFHTIPWSDGFRFGVDIEGSEATAWYAGFDASSSRFDLDWIGLTPGDPLDLTYDAGGSTDDFDDAGHQYAGIWENIEGDVVGTEIYQYAYQRLGFTGPLDLDGVPRGSHGWEKAATGYLAFGTTEKLYEYNVGYLYDITPSGFTTGNVDTTSDSGTGGRYGRGAWGLGPYGVGQQGIAAQIDCDIWHLDTYGEWLVGCMCPSDNQMYIWSPEWGGDRPAQAMDAGLDFNGDGSWIFAESAPKASRGCVVTPERYLCVLGADDDARKVWWSDEENIDVWTTGTTTDAGYYVLDGKGRIMRGLRGRGETVIWTDADVFAMTYIGGIFVFSFERRGFNCGLIAPLAVAAIDSGFVWMSLRGFHFYDGYARSMECPVQDAVFTEIDQTQRNKVNCTVNQAFGEVWWFYPSTPSDPALVGECDRYVIWNYKEDLWSLGQLQRTCGVEASASSKSPLMLSPNGYVYQHETGWIHLDDDEVPLTPYVESGPVELGQGDVVLNAMKLIPDERNLGDVEAGFYSSFYPMQDEVLHGPYTLTEDTDIRLQGRQVRIRLDQVSEDNWRVGDFRFDAVPGGRR